ncbi:PREDICTED: uncharacterized protein LOC109222057 [Nicotiana attenuata]|uniref:uncharacterized protein LOC109222057 n=1 Tax=Nicotiana attenuata TaxID=49451 RepID=UPI000904970E|nr:PREDICTED: uncharacterized protein LOC109222057 [Nicotiana attenuata]
MVGLKRMDSWGTTRCHAIQVPRLLFIISWLVELWRLKLYLGILLVNSVEIMACTTASGAKEREPETGLASLSEMCIQQSKDNVEGVERKLKEKAPLVVHEIIEKIQQGKLYTRKRKRNSVDSCPKFNILSQLSISNYPEPTVDRTPAEQSVSADIQKNDSDKNIVLYSSVDEGIYVSPLKVAKFVSQLDDKKVQGENEKENFASCKGKEVAGAQVPQIAQSANVEEELLGRGKRNRNASWHLKSPYKGTCKGLNWNPKYVRRCCWHYRKTIKRAEDNFEAYLKENKRRGRLPKDVTDIYKKDPVLQGKPYELYNEKVKSRMFFKEMVDDKYTLTDAHIDVVMYFLRKKHIYHFNEYPFASTTTDLDFNDTLEFAYNDWHKRPEKFTEF